MIIHSSRRKMDLYDHLQLQINGQPIKRVKSFNFLGIVINEHLTWTDHIAHISQKINPVVALISRLKHQLPTHILKMIYNSLILSRLHYGNILWGKSPGSLIKLQKKALRVVIGARYNAHTNPIEKKLKLLSLPDIHQTKLICLYKKLVDKKVPNHTEDMFKNIDLLQDLTLPRTKTYENTIRFELPIYLKTAPNYFIEQAQLLKYPCFKYKIKSHILERYSSLCTVLGCRNCQYSMVSN